jgi:hypothetical protein
LPFAPAFKLTTRLWADYQASGTLEESHFDDIPLFYSFGKCRPV